MAGSIKGITVEIGGDTTPLKTALKDVNSESANLKTELREVEKLLKLDPTNTTLLAQKQELLGKQVETTKEKLERLKSVEEQVEQQFANGEIDDGQYRAFQRELVKTEEELQNVEKRAGEAGSEVKDAGGKAKESGNDASDGKSKWESFGNAMKSVGEVAAKAVAALGAAAVAAGTAIVGMTASAAANADEINTLAKTTGLSTETIQKFQYASEQIDVSLDTLAGSLKKCTTNMNTARGGTGDAADAFKKLGVSITDANGELRDNEDVFYECIDALSGVANETERDALAMTIFGKSATDLNPLIEGGVETLQELGDAAEEAGLILSQDALDGLNEFQDSIDTAKATITSLGNLFSTVFAGEMAQVVNEFTEYAKRLGMAFQEGGVDALADEFGTVLGEIVTKITDILPDIIEGGLRIVETLAQSLLDNVTQITESAVEIVTMLAEAIIGALPRITEAAIEILTTMITAIADNTPELIESIVQTVVEVAQTLVDNLPALLDALLQLVEGLATGIIDSIPTLVDKIPDVIDGIVTALVSFIPKLIETGITIFVALIENLPAIIEGIVAAIPEIITSIINGLTDLIPKIVNCGVDLFVALIENLPAIIVAIVKAVPQIVTAIIKGFINLFASIAETGKNLFTMLISRSGEILASIKGFVSNLVSGIISTIAGWFSSFSDVGYNIVTGIWNGISSGWSWLTSKVSSLASSLLNAAKSALGIHSPSTAFRDQIGKMMAAGIGEGFDVEIPKTFAGVKSKLQTEESKLAASMVTNNSTITTHNTTSLGGISVYLTGNIGSAAEATNIGNEIADKLQRALRYKGVLSLA